MQLSRSRLVRVGAMAGVAGGVLRAAASFAPVAIGSPVTRESLYVTVDVCLIAGLLSVYVPRRQRVGRAGVIGVALAVLGMVIVRVSRVIAPIDLYPLGAAAVASGVILLSVSEWAAGRMAGWIPVAFVLSMVVGIIGSVVMGTSLSSSGRV